MTQDQLSTKALFTACGQMWARTINRHKTVSSICLPFPRLSLSVRAGFPAGKWTRLGPQWARLRAAAEISSTVSQDSSSVQERSVCHIPLR